MILALFVSLFAVSAWAGAPLKGVDVKLGKNPGGSPAARTTSSDGKAGFGVLPAGSYYVVADAPKSVAEEAQIEISGATEGTVKKRWNFAQKKAFGVDSTAREAGADKIVFTSDGKHPIDVAATAVVKAKSNISNN
jgi:hypothetical protein